jgi:arylsulfatase A-like enzyme
LLIRVPGCPAGLETDALVSNIDLMPTLADLAGCHVPEGVEGRSFSPVLRGRADRHREAVVLEHGDPGKALRRETMGEEAWEELKRRPSHHLCPEICRGRTLGIVTDRWKYCRTQGDVDELYDLAADPHELHNLAADPGLGHIVRQCRERLPPMTP